MRLLTTIILLLFTSFSIALFGQNEKKLVRSGNGQYEDGNYQEAEVQYRKALTENPNYYNGKFNLGDAMYEQENYEESGKIFNELAEANITPEQKAGVYYNLGNNLMNAQKWGEAVEAFKRSLRLKPDDFDAKYNLEYARKKLAEQQQQQQQDQDQDQDKQDQEDKQDQKDQDKDDQQKDQDQKGQEEKEDQQQNQDQQDQKDQEQDKQQQQQPQQISKQDAQRMLDALKNDEKKTLQKLQEQKAKAAKGSKSEIDW